MAAWKDKKAITEKGPVKYESLKIAVAGPEDLEGFTSAELFKNICVKPSK